MYVGNAVFQIFFPLGLVPQILIELLKIGLGGKHYRRVSVPGAELIHCGLHNCNAQALPPEIRMHGHTANAGFLSVGAWRRQPRIRRQGTVFITQHVEGPRVPPVRVQVNTRLLHDKHLAAQLKGCV